MCGENDDREVSIFLGAWKTIVSGTLLWLASAICIYQGKKQYDELVFSYERFWYWFCMVIFVAAISHTLSGFMLLFGLWKDYKRVFFVGMIMSNIMPFVLTLTGIIPVIQFLCVIRAFTYYKMNWP